MEQGRALLWLITVALASGTQELCLSFPGTSHGRRPPQNETPSRTCCSTDEILTATG